MGELLKFVDDTEHDKYNIVNKKNNMLMGHIIYNHPQFPGKWIPYMCNYDDYGDDRLSELSEFLDKLNGE